MEEQLDIVDRAIEVRAADDGSYVFVISDESVDSHGTKFMLKGWDLSYATRNGVVTYGHPPLNSTDDTLIIARYEPYIEDGKLKARVVFNEKNPRAVRVKDAVDGGFIKMASIRAIIEDAEWGKGDEEDVLIFTRQQLFDFGILPHGSNKNAMVELRNAVAKRCGIEKTRATNTEETQSEENTQEEQDQYDTESFRQRSTQMRMRLTNFKNSNTTWRN